MLIFDIETTALQDAADYIEPGRPPANYKDPVKIQQYLLEKSAAELAQAALDPDLCTIRAIGAIAVPGETFAYAGGLKIVDEGERESEMLQWFWSLLAQSEGRCIGYNILGFDFPVLLHRSMALGIDVPLLPSMARYRIGPVYDLFAILYNWGPGRGLKWVAKRYGLPIDLPGVDGADVAGMTTDQLRAYLSSEIRVTAALYNRMRPVFFPDAPSI